MDTERFNVRKKTNMSTDGIEECSVDLIYFVSARNHFEYIK